MASSVIQTLVTELTADGANMRAEMAQSVRDTEKWGARVSSIAKNAALGFVAGGLTVGAGLAALTKIAIDNADVMGEQAEMLGTTTERLSAMSYAAHMSGMSQEELNASMTKLNRVSADAFKGVGKGVEVFDILGVSVTDADGKLKDSSVLITELSDKFSTLPEGPAKSALAMDLFGKSGSKLIPLLNQGSEGIAELTAEAERLGLVISTDTAKQAGQFNDQMDKLGFAVDGLGLRIASSALPALNDLTDVVNDPATQEGLANIAAGIVKIGASIVDLVSGAGNFGKWLGEQASAMFNGISADDITGLEQRRDQLLSSMSDSYWERFSKGGTDDLFGSKEELQAKLNQLNSMIASYYKRQEDLAKSSGVNTQKAFTDGLKNESGSSFDPAEIEKRWKVYQQQEEGKKKSEKATADLLAQEKQLNSEIVSQGDAYRRQLNLVSESTELQKLHYEIAFGSLKGINIERQRELELMAEVIDAQTAANLKARERKEIEDLLLTDAERINKVWDERIKKIKELAIGEAEAAELMRKAQAQREEELKKTTDGANKEMSEFSKQAARAMQSAFADFLFDPFEDGLDGLANSFARTLQRMAAEAAAAAIFDSIGAWGKSNSGSGGTVGFFAGIASMLGGAYAEGGRPPMGKISVVGDGGEPELFVPDTAGTIIPFSKLGGGGMSLSIGSMVFPGITNANEAKRAAGAAGRELLSVMSAAQRYA